MVPPRPEKIPYKLNAGESLPLPHEDMLSPVRPLKVPFAEKLARVEARRGTQSLRIDTQTTNLPLVRVHQHARSAEDYRSQSRALWEQDFEVMHRQSPPRSYVGSADVMHPRTPAYSRHPYLAGRQIQRPDDFWQYRSLVDGGIPGQQTDGYRLPTSGPSVCSTINTPDSAISAHTERSGNTGVHDYTQLRRPRKKSLFRSVSKKAQVVTDFIKNLKGKKLVNVYDVDERSPYEPKSRSVFGLC